MDEKTGDALWPGLDEVDIPFGCCEFVEKPMSLGVKCLYCGKPIAAPINDKIIVCASCSIKMHVVS